MKRLKLLVVIVLFLSLIFVPFVRDSCAVIDPLTGYIAVSAVLHAVVIGGAVAYKYFKRENGGTQPTSSHKVSTSTGTVGREATVAWVNLNDDNTFNTNTKNVSAKVLFADLKNTVSTQQEKYPGLNNALSTVGYVDVATKAVSGNPVGQTFKYGSAYYYISSWLSGGSTSGAGDFGPNKMYSWNSTTKRLSIHTDWNGTYFRRLDTYQCVQTATIPPPVPSSGSDFANNIKNSSDNTVQSVYRGEIDELIQSNPNIVHYSDTADAGAVDIASDFVGPPAPTASDLATASAKHATTAAWQNYSSNKTPENYSKWIAQKALEDQALTRQSDVKQGVQDALEEAATGTIDTGTQDYGTNPDPPDKKDILQMIRDRMSSILSSSPLIGIINQTRATASGEVSTLTFYLGIANAHKTVDFEPYSGPISVLGSVILSFAHILAVFILFRGD